LEHRYPSQTGPFSLCEEVENKADPLPRELSRDLGKGAGQAAAMAMSAHLS
jgi:hypothetical protein